MGATLMSISMLPALLYASSDEAIVQQVLIHRGWLKPVMLIAWLIGARVVGKGPSLGRRLVLGLVFLTFFLSQGLSVIDMYRNSDLYLRRKTMAISDLQVIENVFHSREFSGRKILPVLVADHMPSAKVFLYDEMLYSKELLGWSGRNPESTFVVGGYEAMMKPSFKAACLNHPHVIYVGRSTEPLFIATPLSVYERETHVFLMKDALMDYLIPGSWRVCQHE
jgi:hypothetical protein